jgi:hypothetical protein
MAIGKQLLKDLKAEYRLLLDERETLRPVWAELADNFSPLTRPILDENVSMDNVYRNFGEANDNIFDSTPILAKNVAAAGMQGGMTSPSQKWYSLGHSDPVVNDDPRVKIWLEDAENIMFDVMARSNFYNATHETYLEIPIMGTSVLIIEESLKDVIRCSVLYVGEFTLAADGENKRTTLFREFVLTAGQMVEKFGEENVSASVKIAAKSEKSKYQRFAVVHSVFPNKNRKPESIDKLNKPFLSVYFEKDSTDKFLSLGGFDSQPFMAPRWGVVARHVYGSSPAMDLLQFAKQLQAMTLAQIEAAQKELDPPLTVPPGMKRVNLTPGALNPKMGAEGATPTIQVQSRPQHTVLIIQDLREQIREGLFNDLFKSLALSPSATMTATEVRERVVEGLRLLGPVLERLQHEFLSPIIDRIFDICLKRGLFPEPPEQLRGAALNVEYVSPLAQAQKAQGLASLNQLIGFLGAAAQYDPTVMDGIDFDEMLRYYASISGVSPKILEDEETVAAKREARRQAQELRMRGEIEKNTADNLKTLSETKTGEGNALSVVEGGAA